MFFKIDQICIEIQNHHMIDNIPLEYNIGIFGSGGVGKTAISLRFILDQFCESYVPTIEDQAHKTVDFNGKQVNLCIIDTAGQEEFSQLRDLTYQRCDGFIFVFDMGNSNTLDEISEIQKSALEAFSVEKNTKAMPCVLAANKCDLVTDQTIRNSVLGKGRELAAKFKCKLIESSSKTPLHINDLFLEVVRRLLDTNDTEKGCCLIC